MLACIIWIFRKDEGVAAAKEAAEYDRDFIDEHEVEIYRMRFSVQRVLVEAKKEWSRERVSDNFWL